MKAVILNIFNIVTQNVFQLFHNLNLYILITLVLLGKI